MARRRRRSQQQPRKEQRSQTSTSSTGLPSTTWPSPSSMPTSSTLGHPREGSWRQARPSSMPPSRQPGPWHRGYKLFEMASTSHCLRARAREVEDHPGPRAKAMPDMGLTNPTSLPISSKGASARRGPGRVSQEGENINDIESK
eukprot:8905809-Heterocapsa_arctica.AAC.1